MNFTKDLANFLTANVPGINVYYNTKVKDNDVIPDLAVFIYSYAGKKPDRCFGNRVEVRHPRAFIQVRSNIEGSIDGNELEDAWDLTETIYETLQTADLPGYEDVKFMDGNFEQGNKDDQNRTIWAAKIEGFINRNP